jgi:hypothetical protein
MLKGVGFGKKPAGLASKKWTGCGRLISCFSKAAGESWPDELWSLVGLKNVSM